jgi:hypothetical protein
LLSGVLAAHAFRAGTAVESGRLGLIRSSRLSNVAFYGGLATSAADVTGDDAADLVAVSSNAVGSAPSSVDFCGPLVTAVA